MSLQHTLYISFIGVGELAQNSAILCLLEGGKGGGKLE